MSHSSRNLTLVADIGGTNTRVALADGVTLRDGSVRRFRNADNSSLEDVLNKYFEEFPCTPQSACSAIAGPVKDGKGTLTNLDWTVDREMLRNLTGAENTSVINDLQAQGHAVEHLGEAQTSIISKGATASSHAARLVIGVGTGFNAAAVYRTEQMTVVPPAEAGHVDLPTRSAESRALADYLNREYGFASVEDALSGRGLERIYSWLQETHGQNNSKSASEIMSAVESQTDPIAAEAVGVFCRVLGAVAGNLALTLLPFGGIYLIGGVARAMLPYMESAGFQTAFADKGRFTDFMAQFPISAITDDYAALIGMAALMDEIRQGTEPRS